MPKVVLRDKHTVAWFQKRSAFSWQAQNLGHVHVHFALQAQHVRRVVLRVFATRIVRAASIQVVTTCKSRGRRGTS